VTSTVSLTGGGLAGNAKLIAPFGFQLAPASPAKEEAGNWTFNLTVGADVPVGVYPIRVQTDDGISNPLLFAVGQLNQVAEKEDNSSFETAQSLPKPPLVIEGQASGNDVDYYRFSGQKGQTIVLDAQCSRIGSGLDPAIRMTRADGPRTFVASADDSPGLLTDARLTTTLPEDGDYVVEISDSKYQGAGRAIYRLIVGPVPMAEEVYPLGGRAGETVGLELRGGTISGVAIAAATLSTPFGAEVVQPRLTNQMLGLGAPSDPILDVESLEPRIVGHRPELREDADPASNVPIKAVAPIVFNGRIDPPGDTDTFALAVAPGQRVRITVEASEFGSALDGVLQVLDTKGGVIANADDTTIQGAARRGRAAGIVLPDPSLDLTVPGSNTEVILSIRDLEGRGGIGYPYRIVVEPITPDFELAVNEAQLSVPKGGVALSAVSVTRKGYDGPISLTVIDPPPGLSVRPSTIAAGQTVGAFSLSAAPDANFGVVQLRLVGRGEGPTGPIERVAVKDFVFSQQANLPTSTRTFLGLTAAPALPAALTFDVPNEPIEVAHGFGTSIPVKLKRAEGADAALTITPLPLPPGLTVPNATIAEKAGEGSVAVNTAVESALGMMTLGLTAKGKFADGERVLPLPTVSINVVRPVSLEIASQAIEVKPGESIELKGKVLRKGAFKEPVTLKINGLPAGLKAEPVTVAPDASEFSIKVTAEANATAAEAKLQVVTAFQINKKDYPTPPADLALKVVPAK
jgi:hypothetical protein